MAFRRTTGRRTGRHRTGHRTGHRTTGWARTKDPRRRDFVAIIFRRNPITGRRRITRVRILGNVRPCLRFLVVGSLVNPAVRCLLANGFVIVRSVDNVIVLERRGLRG
jgi:hypothetical protein